MNKQPMSPYLCCKETMASTLAMVLGLVMNICLLYSALARTFSEALGHEIENQLRMAQTSLKSIFLHFKVNVRLSYNSQNCPIPIKILKRYRPTCKKLHLIPKPQLHDLYLQHPLPVPLIMKQRYGQIRSLITLRRVRKKDHLYLNVCHRGVI